MSTNNINLLMLLLQEKKYPYFEYEELEAFLESNNNNVYLTASKLCLMKADMDKKIKVGPVEIEGPGATYWNNLATSYLETANNSSSGTIISGYKNQMLRADDI